MSHLPPRPRTPGPPLLAGLLGLAILFSILSIAVGTAVTQRQQKSLATMQDALIMSTDMEAALGDAKFGVDDYVLSRGRSGSALFALAQARTTYDAQHITAPAGLSATTKHQITQAQRLAPQAIADLQQALTLAERGYTAAASTLLSGSGAVGASLYELHTLLARIERAERLLLSRDQLTLNTSEKVAVSVELLLAVATFGLLGAAVIMVRRALDVRELSAREIAQAQAQAHIDSLEESNRRMRDFLEVVSHEIRTPLTSLTLALQVTERTIRKVTTGGGPDGHQRDGLDATLASRLLISGDAIDRALVSSTLLERMVADLVDIAHIEAGTLDVRPVPCDLHALIEGCVDEQRRYHPGRDYLLTLPKTPIIVRADAPRIRQVVTNYLSNAYKFSEEYQPISVYLTANAREAKVRVIDEGLGISPEDQRHIWDPFYRVPGAGHVSGSSEGFGLGLYLCAQIIEKHHGRYGIDSGLGRGSVFWFTLPCVDNTAAHTEVAVTPRDTSAT